LALSNLSGTPEMASIESGERQSWKRSDGCPVGAEQVCRDSM
jgi:hypothetical protein